MINLKTTRVPNYGFQYILSLSKKSAQSILASEFPVDLKVKDFGKATPFVQRV